MTEYAGAYNASKYYGIYYEVTQHMVRERELYTDESLIELALEYTTVLEFSKDNKPAYLAAARRDMLGIVCAHMYKARKDWMEQDILQEALKYADRSSFQRSSNAAYLYALRHNLLEAACMHMGKAKKGYDKTKVGFLYIYDLPDVYGFGITNNLDVRRRDYKCVFKKAGITGKLLCHYSGEGASIAELEKYIKTNVPIANCK